MSLSVVNFTTFFRSQD